MKRTALMRKSLLTLKAHAWQLWLLCVAMFALGFCCLVQAQHVMAEDLALLAPDETLFFAQASSIADLRVSLQATPFGKLWHDPYLALFLKPLKDKWASKQAAFEKEKGITLREFEEIFPGEAAVFLSELRYTQNESRLELMMENNTGFIGRFRGSPDRIRQFLEQRFFKDLPPDTRRSSDSFQGISFYTTQFKRRAGGVGATGSESRVSIPQENLLEAPMPPEEGGAVEYLYEYAFAGDLFILLEGPRAYMKKVLANLGALKAGQMAPGALGHTFRYQRAVGMLSKTSGVYLYVNAERLLGQMNQNPQSRLLDRAAPLRLEEMEAFAAGARFSSSTLELEGSLLVPPVPKGLCRLISGVEQNSFQSLRMAPTDSVLYACAVLDLSDIYQLIREYAGFINKDEGRALDQVVEQIARGTGVSIPDLLAQADGEIAWVSFPLPESETGIGRNRAFAQAALVKLKSEEGIASRLTALLPGLLGGPAGSQAPSARVKTEEFRGVAIHTIAKKARIGASAAVDPLLSFAVVRSFLVMGTKPEAVRQVVQQALADDGGGLETRAEYRRGTARLRPGAAVLAWYNLRSIVEQALRLMQSQPLAPLSLGRYFQPSQMPEPQDVIRHFGELAGALHRESGRVRARIILPNP